MKIQTLQLRNFTVFEQVDLAFASGVNVFIGENGTGKTHLLKLLYAMLRGAPQQPVDEREAARLLKTELADVFKPDDADVGRLVRTSAEDEGASARLKTDGGDGRFRIDGSSGDLLLEEQAVRGEPKPIFLPARDVLAMYEGFVALYSKHKIPFDKTYHDVCLALGDAELRDDAELGVPLLNMLGGKVLLRGTRFYVDFGDGPREAHLVAEGLRKVATLARLLGNGSIAPGAVLLWDEPEANLNPKLIASVAVALHELSASGVQLFVATHDYLLAHKLSLIAEYEQAPRADLRFFALHRESPIAPVHVESAPSLARIEHNAILDEYARHNDEQRELYREALARDLMEER